MEVSLQKEMASPQGTKVFTVKGYGLPEDVVSFRTLCGVQSLPLVFAPNRAFVCGPATVACTGRDSLLQVCVLLSWVLKLDDKNLVNLVSQPK